LSRIKGAVFTPDGTILNSVSVHLKAWAKALEDNGYFVHHETLQQSFGMATPRLLRSMVGEVSDKVLEKIERDYIKNFRESLSQIKLFPDSLKALEMLKKAGIKVGIAALTDAATAELILDKNGVLSFVDAIVGSDEVPFGRPDPDIFVEAFKRIGVNPTMGAVIGSTEYDALSARKINALSIVISRDSAKKSVKFAELLFRDLIEAAAEILSS
jgi:Predicted phosphatase/phosphohexomutase